MKFNIVFENTGDTIPFEVRYNHDLIDWFIDKANQENCNQFFNKDNIDKEIDAK